MILWLILALLTGAAALWLIRPLMAAAPPLAGEEAERAAGYRGALEAVERDRAEALMGAEAAGAERAAIARALIALTAPHPSASPSKAPPRWLMLGLVALLPLAGAALYLGTGLSEGTSSALIYSQQSKLEDLARRFGEKIKAHPKDPQAYRLLGLAQIALGRYGEAAKSYERVLALGPRTSADLTAHAEMLARASGKIGPDVLADLDEALKLDPSYSLARADRAQARGALGDHAGAREDWLYLAGIAPAGEWKDDFRRRAEMEARAAKTGGLPPLGEGEDPGAMIQGMVDRLAARLEANPQDLPGWLRLIHSYVVLGERDKAEAAAERARKLFGGDAKAKGAIEAELGPSG